MSRSVGDVVAAIASEAGRREELRDAVLVGGAVRDALTGRTPRELDVASATPGETAERLARIAGSSVVPLGGAWELRRVPLEDGWIDVTPLAGTLEADLGRRDFTIDALAVPLGALPARLDALGREAVIDRHGGLADLEARVVREVAPGAIAADPVRALRGVRLVAQLGFAIEAETERTIAAEAASIDGVAAERVGAELTLLFESERAHAGVRAMGRTGLLDVCFPELVAGREVSQRPHHTWDVLEHQLVTLEFIDALLASDPPNEPSKAAIWHATWDEAWPPTRWGEVRAHLERHAGVLRLATLLHDIGKPQTRTVEADGRTRFFGHPEVGAGLAAVRLRHWRFPTRTIERVTLLLEQHLRPGQVSAPGEPPSARALHRFQDRLGDATPDVCLLFLADSLGTAGVETLLPRWPAYVAHVQRIACWHPPESAREVTGIVDGHAVIAATGLEPGPAVGRILEAIGEAAAAGEVSDRESALDLARRLASEEGS